MKARSLSVFQCAAATGGIADVITNNNGERFGDRQRQKFSPYVQSGAVVFCGKKQKKSSVAGNTQPALRAARQPALRAARQPALWAARQTAVRAARQTAVRRTLPFARYIFLHTACRIYRVFVDTQKRRAPPPLKRISVFILCPCFYLTAAFIFISGNSRFVCLAFLFAGQTVHHFHKFFFRKFLRKRGNFSVRKFIVMDRHDFTYLTETGLLCLT